MTRPCDCSSSDLVRSCGLGTDSASWEEFVARFNRRIVASVIRERRRRGLAADPAEAEVVGDLVQEVYVRLIASDRRALRDFRGEGDAAVFAYLGRIVRAAVGDRLRRERSLKRFGNLVSIDAGADGDDIPALADRLVADKQSSPDIQMGERSAAERLREMLLAVGVLHPDRDALIFELHALEGLSAREIAGIVALDLTHSAVEGILRRTRERLRERLGKVPDLSA